MVIIRKISVYCYQNTHHLKFQVSFPFQYSMKTVMQILPLVKVTKLWLSSALSQFILVYLQIPVREHGYILLNNNIWMLLMIENGFFLFGAFVNLFLIFKIVIRPVLWSTTNTFLCCLLCLNSFHLLVQVFLLKEKSIPLLDDAFLQSLDYMFYDINTSKICSAEYICGFVHGSLTLNVLTKLQND